MNALRRLHELFSPAFLEQSDQYILIGAAHPLAGVESCARRFRGRVCSWD